LSAWKLVRLARPVLFHKELNIIKLQGVQRSFNHAEAIWLVELPSDEQLNSFNRQVYSCWTPVEQWGVLLTSQIASSWSKPHVPFAVLSWECLCCHNLLGFGMFITACAN